MLSLSELRIVTNMFKKGEGLETHLYQDSVGLVTIGIGNMVPNAQAVTELNMVNSDGSPATDAEKKLAYEAVWKAPGPRTDKSVHQAAYYASYTSVRMQMTEVNTLFNRRVMEAYKDIKQLFPDFDSFPASAKFALMDMVFNLGYSQFKRDYVRLKVAVRSLDWTKAADECHRKGPGPIRNRETRQLFLEAAAVAKQQQMSAVGHKN